MDGEFTIKRNPKIGNGEKEEKDIDMKSLTYVSYLYLLK